MAKLSNIVGKFFCLVLKLSKYIGKFGHVTSSLCEDLCSPHVSRQRGPGNEVDCSPNERFVNGKLGNIFVGDVSLSIHLG